MEYILIEFTVGLEQQAYQVISGGQVQKYVDLDGNDLVLPDVTESRVVNANPERPSWAV